MLTSLQRTGFRDFAGYVFDPRDPERTFLVEILIDGAFHVALRADRRLPEPPALEAGSPCGFAFSLPDDLLAGARMIEAWVANHAVNVGAPISLEESYTSSVPSATGEVRWLGGLQVSGWSAGDSPLLVLVDGVPVERVHPTVWRHVSRPQDHGAAVRAFTTHLPERFADGASHHCAITTIEGLELPGSPFALLAWPDALARLAACDGASRRDVLRARLFDQMTPASVSFVDYEAWRSRPEAAAHMGERECTVVLVGSGKTEVTIASLHEQTHGAWLAAALPPQGPVGFSPECLADVLRDEAPDSAVIVFALAGTFMYTAALARLCAVFSTHPEARVAYCDLDIRAGDGLLWPLAFPAFDRERLLEQGYCAHVFAVRRETLALAIASGATDLYGLFMAVALADGEAQRSVVHVPDAAGVLPDFDRQAASLVLAASSLAHLTREGLPATAAAGGHGILPNVWIRREHANPRVTIMIPTRNRRDLLESCFESIRPAVRRNDAEVFILDNDTSEPETLRYLRELEQEGVRRIVVPGPFNFARMNNRGAHAATGSLLCLLNNDVRAEDAGWLDTLLGSLTEPDVGAVAPLLLWPSRVVQHAGLVLGPRFEVAHAFSDRIEGDAGFGDLLRVAHECSAVTAACLLTRRSDYLAVGGMDARHFPINFNDIDYCVKLRAAGRRVIFTPHARLIHAESSSRGRSWTEDRRRLFDRERRALQMKWGEVLADDPYYSPVLALTPQPYAALSSQERPMPPRFNALPLAREVPDGF